MNKPNEDNNILLNIPSMYLQDISKKRDSLPDSCHWIFFHFILTPRIWYDFCVFSINARNKHCNTDRYNGWANAAIVILICVYFFINYILKTTFAISLSVWPGICLLINFVTLLLIDIFSFPSNDELTNHANVPLTSIRIELARMEESLSRDITGLSENLFGHKVWAGNNTHRLLKSIWENSGEKRAKWFMVNFMAEVMDDLVLTDDTKCFKLENEWSTYKYSQYLAKNMENAEYSICWFVDPKDFFRIIIPEFIAYTLACVSFLKFGIPTNDSTCSTAPSSVFCPKHGYDAIELQKICTALQFTCDSVPIIENKGELQQEEYFRKVILTIAKEFGNIIYTDNEPSFEDIRNCFDNILLQQFIDVSLPHFRAFKQAKPQKQTNQFSKLRIIHFHDTVTKEISDSSIANKVIGDNWPHQQNDIKTPNLLWTESSCSWSINLIDTALKLFAHSCGGENNILFVSSTELHIKDSGIYDRHFKIESEPVNSKEGIRKVTLSYWPKPNELSDEALFANKIINTHSNSSTHRSNGVKIVNFADFIKHIVKYPQQMSSKAQE